MRNKKRKEEKKEREKKDVKPFPFPFPLTPDMCLLMPTKHYTSSPPPQSCRRKLVDSRQWNPILVCRTYTRPFSSPPPNRSTARNMLMMKVDIHATSPKSMKAVSPLENCLTVGFESLIL